MADTRTHGEPHGRLYAAGMVKRLMLGVQEFRTNLAARVKAIEEGEHTVLAVRGKAVAVMVPIEWYRQAAEKLGDPTEF